MIPAGESAVWENGIGIELSDQIFGGGEQNLMIFAPVTHGVFPGFVPPVSKVEEHILYLPEVSLRNMLSKLIEDPHNVYQSKVGTIVLPLNVLQGAVQAAPFYVDGILNQVVINLILLSVYMLNGALRDDLIFRNANEIDKQC
jgi:hypothetical protein